MGTEEQKWTVTRKGRMRREEERIRGLRTYVYSRHTTLRPRPAGGKKGQLVIQPRIYNLTFDPPGKKLA